MWYNYQVIVSMKDAEKGNFTPDNNAPVWQEKWTSIFHILLYSKTNQGETYGAWILKDKMDVTMCQFK